MKKTLIVVAVFALVTSGLVSSPAAALDLDELDGCTLASWADWHHPGLNAMCVAEIIFQLVGDGVLSPEEALG